METTLNVQNNYKDMLKNAKFVFLKIIFLENWIYITKLVTYESQRICPSFITLSKREMYVSKK